MNYLKIAYLLLLMYIQCIYVRAQTTPVLVNISKPSPNVQAMQKYGDIPVSPYTGVPDISIPIYTAKFRDISVPISLSYHASGIKVSEEASQVGLGWVLNAGGSISRNIIGDDDFDGTAYLNTALPDLDSGLSYQGIVQLGCILQLVNQKYPSLPTLYNDTLTSVIGAGYPVDCQPDQYYYNLQGKSGKFTLRHNGQVLLEKQEKLDISFSSGGASWEIKDEKGYIYDFTKYETYQAGGGGAQHKSAWQLTQITSPTGNKVTFNYTLLPANFLVPVGSFYETKDVANLPVITANGQAFYTGTMGYQYGTASANTYYPQLLTSIDFTDGTVQFNYSGNRTDLPNDVKLDSVSVYEKDAYGNVAPSPIKTFRLSYGYFFGENYCNIQGAPSYDTAMDPSTTRLRLDSVQNVGYYGGQYVTEAPYRFSYNQMTPAQQPSKKSLARDNWGYCNGRYTNVSLIPSVVSVASSDAMQTIVGVPGPERNTDTAYSKLFSLTSITYPTGGSTEFQMEANDYDLTASQVNDHTQYSYLEATQPELSSSGYDVLNNRMYEDSVIDMSTEYYVNSSGTSTFVPATISIAVRMQSEYSTLYRLNNQGLIYFSLLDSNGNVVLSKDLGNLGICDANDQTACLADTDGVYKYTYTNVYLPPNKYTLRAYVSPIFDTSASDFLININWQSKYGTGLIQDAGVIGNYGFAGGLRAKRVIDHDGISTADDHIKHYIYHYTANKGSGTLEYSYGRRMSKPQYFYFDWVAGAFDGNVGDAEFLITQAFFCDHLFRSADSENPLNGSAAGSAVGYDQVTILDGDNGENGESVYNYFNQPDIINDYSWLDGLPHRPPANSTQSFQMNGTLLSKTDYANNGGVFYKLKQTTDDYNLFPTRQNTLYGFEIRKVMSDGTYQAQNDCAPNILMFYPAIQSEWNTLVDHDVKVYNKPLDTVDYVESKTNYYYTNPAHFLPTQTVTLNSMGDTITTTTHYGLDFSPSATGDAFNNGVSKLNSAHVIDAPVEVFQQHSIVGGSGPFVTKGVLNTYNASIPSPSLFYNLQIASPLSNYVPGSISGGVTTKDPNYVGYVSLDQYDSSGNILQQRKVNDFPHSYVYDYYNSLPVAEVSNAVVTDIAYTSFESNGTGGWTIPNGAIVPGGKTGNNAYTMPGSGSITKSGLNPAKTYIVSYWSKGGSITVNGATGTLGTTVGAWTYYEDSVTATSSVTITGTGVTIDELRLFPKGSLMATCTFDPIIGITSQCSPTNYVTYYGYDGLGRLSYVKDLRGNIIKTYNYHYKGQPN